MSTASTFALPVVTRPNLCGVTVMRLTNGLPILVDESDYPTLNQYKWKGTSGSRQASSKYAVANKNGKDIRMHRLIMNAPPELEVDHINHDGRDNRRVNLRLCTRQQNCANNKGKGTRLDRRYDTWVAQIKVNHKTYCLGSYPTEEEGMRAYDAAALYYNGEFARTNFPGTEAKSAEEILAASPIKERSRRFLYKGVTKNRDKWVARINVGDKRVYLGIFAIQEEAAMAFNEAVDRFGLKAARKNDIRTGGNVNA